MFQKHSIMSLKKKSKSLGHLTALGSPNFGSPKMKKQILAGNSNSKKFAANGSVTPSMNGRAPPTRSTTALNFNYSQHQLANSQLPHQLTPQQLNQHQQQQLYSEEVYGKAYQLQQPNQTPSKGIKTTTPKKLKGLVRQKTTNSMPNPVAMGRAFLAKATTNNNNNNSNSNNNKTGFAPKSPFSSSRKSLNGLRNNGGSSNSSGSPAGHFGVGEKRSDHNIADVFGTKDAGLIPNKHRAFLMDSQVKYTVGVSSQERNIFLFNDLLLIAKERSSSHFKLKDQIPLSDIWLSNCISEVSEVTLDPTTSFVIGWPITNAVVTFASSAQKKVWWDRLSDLIEKERSHTPQTTNIQVTYFDQATNFEHMKSIQVGVEFTCAESIVAAMKALELPPSEDPKSFQLWVRTRSEEAPYPLIGHEIPLVIKLHWTRQAFNASRGSKTYDEYKAGCRCSFILRKVGQRANLEAVAAVGSQKTKLKKVKSSIKLQNVFRRVSQGSHKNSTTEAPSVDSNDKKPGILFCRNLDQVCSENTIPKPIRAMLKQIAKEGPSTVGIFRRSPNARAMRDIREKLDTADSAADASVVDFAECSVFVTAALIKDFLRSLPDCLLMCEHYHTWIELARAYNDADESVRSVDAIKSFVSTLPRMNMVLLQSLCYLLNKIASASQENMMTGSNLAICVGPSLLWSTDSSVMLDQAYSKQVSEISQILIEQFENIFGSEVPVVYTESEDLEATAGAAEPKSKTVARKLYDNSSLDSLLDAGNHYVVENDLHRNHGQFAIPRPGQFITGQSSAGQVGSASQGHLGYPPSQPQHLYIQNPQNQQQLGSTNPHEPTSSAGVSLTNLSHDSGLTTSDSQLYAFDGENNSLSSDEFCIENVAKDNPNSKRPLAKQSSYGGQSQARDFHLPGQVPSGSERGRSYAANQAAAVQKPRQNRVATSHRDRIYKRMQRHSKDNQGSQPQATTTHFGSKYPAGLSDADQAFMIDTTSFTMRRTASEESISQQSAPSIRSSSSSGNGGHNGRSRRRPVAHRKGRAPAPPGGKGSATIVRSNSVNQVRGDTSQSRERGRDEKRSADWYRSRSTTRLNHHTSNLGGRRNGVTSSSCSTLSDEDCTPHVSRSNSYGRPEDNIHHSSHGDGSYDIYLHDDHLTVGGEAFITTTPMASNNSTTDTPPGYEETMSRQRLLKNYQRSNSFVISSSHSPVTPVQNRKRLSDTHAHNLRGANVKTKLFDDTRLVIANNFTPPPLPPKTDRPPLPPKQRLLRLSSVDDTTYANSADLKYGQRSYDDESSIESAQLVYPAYTPAGSSARIHISSGTPPQLPPKEKISSSEVSDSSSSVHQSSRKPRRSVTKISTTSNVASTQTLQMSNAETQTDETDFYLLYGEDEWEAIEEANLQNGLTAIGLGDDTEFCESNRSLSPEYYPTFHGREMERQDFLHNNQGSPYSHLNHHQRLMGTRTPTGGNMGGNSHQSPVRAASAVDRRMTEGQTGIGVGTSPLIVPGQKVDPIIQGEINWSVSQLRSLFNKQGQQRHQQGQTVSHQMSSPNHDSSSSNSDAGHGGLGGSNSRLFTNGEYIDSPANKAVARHLLLNGGTMTPNSIQNNSSLYSGGHMDAPGSELADDSDQESYV